VELCSDPQVTEARGVELQCARHLDRQSRHAAAVEMRIAVVSAQHVEQIAVGRGAAASLAAVVGSLDHAVLAPTLGGVQGEVRPFEKSVAIRRVAGP